MLKAEAVLDLELAPEEARPLKPRKKAAAWGVHPTCLDRHWTFDYKVCNNCLRSFQERAVAKYHRRCPGLYVLLHRRQNVTDVVASHELGCRGFEDQQISTFNPSRSFFMVSRWTCLSGQLRNQSFSLSFLLTDE
jgi:hypothetical protein